MPTQLSMRVRLEPYPGAEDRLVYAIARWNGHDYKVSWPKTHDDCGIRRRMREWVRLNPAAYIGANDDEADTCWDCGEELDWCTCDVEWEDD